MNIFDREEEPNIKSMIQELIHMSEDASKFYVKENREAARRLRKKLREHEQKCKQLKKELLEQTHAREREA